MIRIFSENAVRAALDEKKAYALARRVFLALAAGRAQMPPKLYLPVPGPGKNDFRAMPAAFFETGNGGGGACGIKWVSVFPENARKGIPTVHATILLNDPKTGRLLAMLEANTITAVRTAAAAALATHHLAVRHPRKLAIVGAGLQAEYQLKAMASLHRFKEIRVWGWRPGEADRFCRRFRKKFPVTAERGVRESVEDADVIVTCTASRKPLVKKAWVKKGAHINAIGADAKGKEELEPSLVLAAKVVVDEWRQAAHSGEVNVPVSKGLFTRKDLHAELSQVVAGRKAGRVSPSEITIFDSTGLAVLDLYFAKDLYDRVRGQRVSYN